MVKLHDLLKAMRYEGIYGLSLTNSFCLVDFAVFSFGCWDVLPFEISAVSLSFILLNGWNS